MFEFLSILFFLVIMLAGLGYNTISGYYLKPSSNLPEEYNHAKNIISRKTENDQDSDIIWLNPGKRGLPNFTPYISVGVLSNLEEFFDNLSTNMDSIDEEKAVVSEIEADQPLRIKNPLAENYLRGYKPSYKIRNYVQSPDLGLLKGTNHHDPSLKWGGLGKRSTRM